MQNISENYYNADIHICMCTEHIIALGSIIISSVNLIAFFFQIQMLYLLISIWCGFLRLGKFYTLFGFLVFLLWSTLFIVFHYTGPLLAVKVSKTFQILNPWYSGIVLTISLLECYNAVPVFKHWACMSVFSLYLSELYNNNITLRC